MSNPPSGLQRLLSELKRRHVLRVAAGYAAVGFATVSIASDFLPALRLPDWTVTLVAALVLLGFPIALVLAWAFEITPDGVRRAEPLPAENPAAPRTNWILPRSAAGYVGVGILVGLVGVGAYSSFDREPDAARNAAPVITALAVMPFENLSEDPANEYFSDGITEDVTMQLFKLGELNVISRSSMMMYKGGMKPIQQVATELGVGAVVEGSVRRMGDRVRINARLVDARTERQLWADSYDRDLKDILTVQAEIAQQIAAALQTKLSPSAERSLASDRMKVVNPEAYEEYLRGVYESGEGRLEAGIQAYERALALDPTYAPAQAGIARDYYFIGFFGALPPTEAFVRMRDAAVRALELDPDLADAHATLALFYLHYKLDWEKSDEHFRRAIELSPNNARVRHDYAHYLLAVGRTEESAAESARASELDPGNMMLKACAGWHGFTDREYDGAVRSAMSALMMMPSMFWPELVLGWAYEQKGQYKEAIASLRNAVAHSEGMPFAVASLAHSLGKSGQEGQARKLLGDLQEKSKQRYVSAYDFAIVYAGLGDANRTFDWLRKAYAERSAFLVNIGWEPRFDEIRHDPRFVAITESMRLPDRPAPRARPATSEPPMAGTSM